MGMLMGGEFFDDFGECDECNDGLTMGIGIGTSDDREYIKQKSENYDKSCTLLSGGFREDFEHE